MTAYKSSFIGQLLNREEPAVYGAPPVGALNQIRGVSIMNPNDLKSKENFQQRSQQDSRQDSEETLDQSSDSDIEEIKSVKSSILSWRYLLTLIYFILGWFS